MAGACWEGAALGGGGPVTWIQDRNTESLNQPHTLLFPQAIPVHPVRAVASPLLWPLPLDKP